MLFPTILCAAAIIVSTVPALAISIDSYPAAIRRSDIEDIVTRALWKELHPRADKVHYPWYSQYTPQTPSPVEHPVIPEAVIPHVHSLSPAPMPALKHPKPVNAVGVGKPAWLKGHKRRELLARALEDILMQRESDDELVVRDYDEDHWARGYDDFLLARMELDELD
ncbi:hypothetical protein DAEQUDRAFT_720395 [Daedalea quercina L-15889]|uniref:Uncharacterized protein n=1 Tax=Daedalea quercina L-15889 TaxID=1314783 RepID=A0A165UN85_9APHY|nr:hypothetical protein DAEQUDRAFT_720395 [Daedalea quercina L-15889]